MSGARGGRATTTGGGAGARTGAAAPRADGAARRPRRRGRGRGGRAIGCAWVRGAAAGQAAAPAPCRGRRRRQRGAAACAAAGAARALVPLSFGQLAANPTFMSGFYAWLVAQVLKVFTTRWTEKKLTLNMLWSSGGMPSSHSVRPAAAPGRCDPCESAGPAAPPDGLSPYPD